MPKNQNDCSNRHDLFKVFLTFRFISKPYTKNKIIYNKTIIKSKEKTLVKNAQLKNLSVKKDLILLRLSNQYLIMVSVL